MGKARLILLTLLALGLGRVQVNAGCGHLLQLWHADASLVIWAQAASTTMVSGDSPQQDLDGLAEFFGFEGAPAPEDQRALGTLEPSPSQSPPLEASPSPSMHATGHPVPQRMVRDAASAAATIITTP